eukprot:COSAG01_NODE_3048_length_6669_cov_138.195282_9_plen_307_part_00
MWEQMCQKEPTVDNYLELMKKYLTEFWKPLEENESDRERYLRKYKAYQVNKRIRKAWLERRLQEAESKLDADVRSVLQSDMCAQLEDRQPTQKTNPVWNAFRQGHLQKTEDLKAQLSDSVENLLEEFQVKTLDVYEAAYTDLSYFCLQVVDEFGEKKIYEIKDLPGARAAVDAWKRLKTKIAERKRVEEMFHLGSTLVRSEYALRLSEQTNSSTARYRREYSDAKQNSLPVRLLLLRGQHHGDRCEGCQETFDDLNTSMKRKWQEYYFFSLLLQDKRAEDVLPYLEPCRFKGPIPHLSGRLVQLRG